MHPCRKQKNHTNQKQSALTKEIPSEWKVSSSAALLGLEIVCGRRRTVSVEVEGLLLAAREASIGEPSSPAPKTRIDVMLGIRGYASRGNFV